MSPELYRRARRAEAKADRADDRRRLRLDFFRAALAEGLDSVKVMHAGGASGQESVQAHARVVDDLVKSLTKLITSDTNGLAATPFVVIALGGYGRGELHPSSDIDLMVIYDAELSPYVQRVTQELLYTLWDLGLQIGHSLRSLPDCVAIARTDLASRTSMQAARFLAGALGVAAKECRCLPGDDCWPATSSWTALNETLEGRLVKTIPIGSPCHDPNYDLLTCLSLRQRWLDTDLQCVAGPLIPSHPFYPSSSAFN